MLFVLELLLFAGGGDVKHAQNAWETLLLNLMYNIAAA